MELSFPIEFLVHGTPVSLQAKRAASREEWTGRVKAASSTVIPDHHYASEERVAVTLFYLPAEAMQGDIDNIRRIDVIIRVDRDPALAAD